MLDTKVDHVAVAVRDIRASSRLYCDVLGATFLAAADMLDQGFRWAQFRFPGGGKVELVTPIGDGFVRRFLDERGEGVHHVTLMSGDLAATLRTMESLGVPVFGVNLDNEGWKEAFIHPRNANGVLIQIAESGWSDEQMARHHLEDHSGEQHRHLGAAEL